MTELPTSSIPKSDQTAPEKLVEITQATPKSTLNPCQGYLVDPLTKLHLCQACPYHRYRNETKPWLKKID